MKPKKTKKPRKGQRETISLDDFMRELYGIKKVEPPAKRGGKKNA